MWVAKGNFVVVMGAEVSGVAETERRKSGWRSALGRSEKTLKVTPASTFVGEASRECLKTATLT